VRQAREASRSAPRPLVALRDEAQAMCPCPGADSNPYTYDRPNAHAYAHDRPNAHADPIADPFADYVLACGGCCSSV
jgi:hypothetical protein